MSTTRAALHGMWVGMSGDMTRLRQLREEVERSNTVQAAWKSTGESIRSTAQKVSSSSRR